MEGHLAYIDAIAVAVFAYRNPTVVTSSRSAPVTIFTWSG
jgi:hypothetical protein